MFANCSGINTIEIPESVTEIGGDAFYGCKNLNTVIVQDNLRNIESYAFANCTNLKTFVCNSEVLSIKNNVFNNDKNLCIYASEYSEISIYAIDNGVMVSVNSDSRYPTGGVLSYKDSHYQYLGQTNSNCAEFTCDYNIKSKSVSNTSIKIKIPSNMNLINGEVKVDDEKTDDYTYSSETHILEIPVKGNSGRIHYSTNIIKTGNTLSYAILNYTVNGKQSKDTIGIVASENIGLTMEVPKVVGNESVNVSGFTEGKKDIKLSIDGTNSVTISSREDGSYSTVLKLDNPQNGESYTIEASTFDESWQELKQTSNVLYKKDTIELTKFQMQYKSHINRAIDLLNCADHNVVMEFNPAYKFAFSVGFNNTNNIEEVYVVSERNGLKKRMKAVWNEKTNEYEASGWFDEENHSYVPGSMYVEYIEKRKETQQYVGNLDLEKEGLLEFAKQFGDYVEVEKVENIDEQLAKSDEDDDETVEREQYNIKFKKEMSQYLTTNQIVKVLFESQGDAGKKIGEIMDEYEIVSKYAERVSENGNAYEMFICKDKSVKENFVILIHDIASDKIIKEILNIGCDMFDNEQLFNNGTTSSNNIYRGISDKISDYNTYTEGVSSVTSTIKSYMEINSDYQNVRENILNSDFNGTKQLELLKKNEELRSDRHNYLLIVTTMSLIMATATATGGVGMASAPILMGLMMNCMGALGSTIFDYRLNMIKTGNSGAILKWMIDPSGYVYEGVESNRLSNVKATIYYRKDENSKEELWDASEYRQNNPIYTDDDGKYAWDVPEGQWRVKFEKDNYQTTYTDWMNVPPPQTNVNIAMVSNDKPYIEYVSAKQGYIELKFSQYIKVDSLLENAISIYDTNNKEIEYKIKVANQEEDGNGIKLTKEVVLYPNEKLKQGAKYTVKVCEKIKNYADNSIVSENKEILVQNDVSLTCKTGTVYVKKGESVLLEIVADNKNIEKLNCTSDIQEIQVDNEVDVNNGTAVVKVTQNGMLDGNVYISVPDSSDTVQIKIIAINDDSQIGDTSEVKSENLSDIAIDTKPEAVKGDVNGDGITDSVDAVLLKKYLAGYSGLQINTDACDMNGDGEVDSVDAVLLLKQLANG